jgi:hypothetical protein
MLYALYASTPITLELAGPIGGAEDCRTIAPPYVGARLEKGRYAVFATTTEPAPPEAVAWLAIAHDLGPGASLAQQHKVYGDPLWQAPLASHSDALSDREIFLHYPFWSWHFDDPKTIAGMKVEALFDDAPAALFVFVSRPMGGIAVGEPLLLSHHGATTSTVLRANGERLDVETSALVSKRSGQITLPAFATLDAPTSTVEMHALASVRDRKLVAEVSAAEDKLWNCVAGDRAKNDPTYGKNYDLINTRTGASLRDLRSSQAARRCGLAAFENRARAAFTKVLHTRREEQSALAARLAKKLE